MGREQPGNITKNKRVNVRELRVFSQQRALNHYLWRLRRRGVTRSPPLSREATRKFKCEYKT